jgi:hypothetical protein
MERIKLDDRVTFPYLLNMRPYLESEVPDERPIIYELFSVLVHRGSSLAGHYYAFTKSFENGKWFEFNDSMVKEISQEEVETSFGADGYQSGFYGAANAYMLMYRKGAKTPFLFTFTFILPPSAGLTCSFAVELERNKTTVPKEEIMPELLTMVESENQKLREEEEKEKIEREMCKFKVHYLSQKKTTSVNKSITIAEITVSGSRGSFFRWLIVLLPCPSPLHFISLFPSHLLLRSGEVS